MDIGIVDEGEVADTAGDSHIDMDFALTTDCAVAPEKLVFRENFQLTVKLLARLRFHAAGALVLKADDLIEIPGCDIARLNFALELENIDLSIHAFN